MGDATHRIPHQGRYIGGDIDLQKNHRTAGCERKVGKRDRGVREGWKDIGGNGGDEAGKDRHHKTEKAEADTSAGCCTRRGE